MKNNKNFNKSFNLLQKDFTNKSFIEKLYDWSMNVGRYIVIGTELFVLIAFGVRFYLDQNLSNLNNDLNSQNETFKANYSVTQKIANNISSEIKFINSTTKTQIPISEILLNLNNAASTSSVNIISIQTEKDQIIVSGTAPSADNVSSFRQSLESKYINVTTSEIIDNSSRDTQNNNIRNKFTLNFKYAQNLSAAN